MIFRRIETTPIPSTQLVFHSITDRAERLVVVAGVFVFVIGGFVADGEGFWIGGRGGLRLRLRLGEGGCEGGSAHG